jgi:hypothetical protein
MSVIVASKETGAAQPVCQTELLVTADCLRISSEITARENDYFGSDFEWSVESTDKWLRSGAMFDAAVSRTAPDGSRRLLGLASVLITGRESYERLLKGEIREQELLPWFMEGPEPTPMLYFATILSDRPEYLAPLYQNLLLDVEAYLQANQLSIHSGFSIAAGPAGFQHLSKNGFVPTGGWHYLHRYHFMRIDAHSAKTDFWRRLLVAPEM